jgi:hypothetical protein
MIPNEMNIQEIEELEDRAVSGIYVPGNPCIPAEPPD